MTRHLPARLALGLIAAAFLFLVEATLPAHAGDVTPGDTTAVQSVIDSQIGAFQARDHERAYSFAAPSVRQYFPTVERFMSMVIGGYKPVYDPDSYRFGRNTEIGGQVHQEVLIIDKAGKSWQAVYTLRRQEDGSWKITGVKLNPSKGLSA